MSNGQGRDTEPACYCGVSLAETLTQAALSLRLFPTLVHQLPVNSVWYLISCQWILFLLRLTKVGFCWLKLRTLLAQCLELGRHSTNICWISIWISFLLTWNYSSRHLMFFHHGCSGLMVITFFHCLTAFFEGFEGFEQEVSSWSNCHPNLIRINILTHEWSQFLSKNSIFTGRDPSWTLWYLMMLWIKPPTIPPVSNSGYRNPWTPDFKICIHNECKDAFCLLQL